MFKFKLIKLIIILLLILTENNLFSQRIASPLNPEAFQTQTELGFFVGFGQNSLMGKIRTKCDCPDFENGSKFGFTLGALFESDITPELQWGVAAIFKSLDITSTYQFYTPREFTSVETGKSETVPILFRQKAEATVSTIAAMPYLKLDVFDWLFIRLGAEAGVYLSPKIKHTEELLQNSARLSTGEPVTIEYTNGKGNVRTVENGPLTNPGSLYLGVTPAIGLKFELDKNFFFSPVFDYTIPLTDISTTSTGFKTATWRINLEMRIALRLRQK